MNLKNHLRKFKTIYKLGVGSVSSVALYRAAIKMGYFKTKTPIQKPIEGPFFFSRYDSSAIPADNFLQYFSKHNISVSSVPEWFRNPWKPDYMPIENETHWSEISEYDEAIGDVKTVWEASRFDWAPHYAYLISQGIDYDQNTAILEYWIRDWCQQNPTSRGLNWKCAQEASLRALNIFLTLKLLGEPFEKPSDSILELFDQHICRISPTTFYARAQNNNHGTSEAVALYCIGCYLLHYGSEEQRRRGAKAVAKGRSLLEDRVEKIILPDGSFSQSSVTYHRLLLDTILLAELTTRWFQLKAFDTKFQERMKAATYWLYAFVDTQSGDAVNLGPNDGTYFGNVEMLPYRDFQPTVKRSLAVFCKKTLRNPEFDVLLSSFGISTNELEVEAAPKSQLFADGGYARLNLRDDRGFLVMRYPKFKFRPAQCDANHLDLWLDGKNIIMDAGSYSYGSILSPGEKKFPYGGTEGHSTVSFDGRDQMPRISRFLVSDWLEPDIMQFDSVKGCLESRYTDSTGAWHHRKVSVSKEGVVIVDDCGGFQNTAVLRWRLPVGITPLAEGKTGMKNFTLQIADWRQLSMEMVTEKNSLYYLDTSDVPVLKVSLTRPGSITTLISFT